MRFAIRHLAIFVVLGISSAANADLATMPAPAPDPLLGKMIAAIHANDLASLSTGLDKRSRLVVADLEKIDTAKMVRIAAFREFARYFGQLPHLDAQQQDILQWLAAQPRLLPTLMSAVNKADPPDSLITLLGTLRDAEGKKLDDYADLSTAILVVWDKKLDPGPQSIGQAHVGVAGESDPNHVIQVFNYFVNSNSLRFNTRDLPWQLAIYMVDVKIAPTETLWALDRYGARSDIGMIYFEVPYDDDALWKGTRKKIEGHDYTLQNLLQYGGVCVDQAYFATQIAKIRGIPSCVCTGQSGAGEVGHAWAGFLEVDEQRASWNFDTARYKEDLFWEADIVDPHTHEELTDADVGLLAELQHSNRDQRLESGMLMKLAGLETPARRMEFYTKAIDLSPGNRLAWLALSQLGADSRLSASEMETVGQVISRYASQRYPDFACHMLVKMAASQAPDAQVQTLEQIAGMFRQRPDLQARIRIRQGDLLHASKKDDDAMRAYGEVLTNDLNAGPIIVIAIKQVDDILREKKDLDRLSKVYNQVWHSMPVPSSTAYAAESPYYEVGMTYARLLDEMGNAAGAVDIRQQLQRLVSGA